MATNRVQEEPKKMQLYSYHRSSCSFRVRIALNLKGLDYEYNAVNLLKREQQSPEFLKVNPIGYVPALVDGDIVLADSFAIVMYLEEKYPEHPLLPRDLEKRAINYQAANIVSASIQPLQNLDVLNYIEEKVGLEAKLPWVQKHIGKGFAALEKLLKDHAGKYATGDEVFLADVFLAPQIHGSIQRFNLDMMSSKLPELHDEELLLYLEYLSMDDKQLGESHSYYRWESVSQNLAKKLGNSLDTNACILASRGHETMYSKYFERNPRLLKHPTLGSSNYLRALHNIYRKTRENVLRHPSTTVGPIRSGRSHGITPYSSSQSSRSHGITPYSSWSVLEPKVTVVCGILYKKKLVTEKEMDDIAEHFKNCPTEVGANVFLDLSVEDQTTYVKNRLAEKRRLAEKQP